MSLVFGVSRVFRVQSSSHLSTVGVRHLRLASASTDDRQQLQSSTVNDRRLRFKSSTKRRPSVSVIYASAAHQSTSVIYQRRPSSKTTGLRKSLFFSARLQVYKSPHSSLQDNESPYSSQQDYRSPRLPSKTTGADTGIHQGGGGHCGGRKITVCEFYFIFGELKWIFF